MARGRVGSFGGKVLNAWWTWIPLSVVFFLGLVDRRRIRSLAHARPARAALLRHLALLLQPRRGLPQRAARVRSPLVYLLVRTAWIGFRGRASQPGALLAGVAARRRGRLPRRLADRPQPRAPARRDRRRLRRRDRRRPDPRRRRRRTATCPSPDTAACLRQGRRRGLRSATGSRRTAAASPRTRAATRTARRLPRVRSGGRCASAGPGSGTRCPPRTRRRSRSTCSSSSACVLVGRRFGGPPLAVALAFGWLAFPFTAYALNSNTNDAIMPAILVWGFWLATSPVARGAAVALAGWTKFAALLLAPLWLTYPNGLRAAQPRCGSRRRSPSASLAVFSVLLLEPSLVDAARDVRRSHARLPARAGLAVLALGLGPVPRPRHPRPRAPSS